MIPIHMGWRHVLFANWPVDPAVVRPHLPAALDVDTHEGNAWLSVVPFTNVDVRPTFGPSGWGVDLPELNLRTYVRYVGRPGVYFHSLDADGLAGVALARLFHHLPYYLADISISVENATVTFESRRRHPGERPVHLDATFAPTGDPVDQSTDSLAHFLTERYRYYTEDQAGRLRSAEIDHPPWPLARATVEMDPTDCFRANGYAVPASDPVHLYSPGVDVRAGPSELV